MAEVLQPEGWPRPSGYANGIAAGPGRLVFVAGQIGWESDRTFRATGFAAQFAKALENVLAVLREAGAGPEHICRITAYCCDKPAYLAARKELREIWRRVIGDHYPAMSVIFVADLLDSPAAVELEATAVLPEMSS